MVKLIEVFNSDTHVFMAMEAVDGRELYDEINRKGKLEERRASDLFLQVTGGFFKVRAAVAEAAARYPENSMLQHPVVFLVLHQAPGILLFSVVCFKYIPGTGLRLYAAFTYHGWVPFVIFISV